jgi:hypothetical protein
MHPRARLLILGAALDCAVEACAAGGALLQQSGKAIIEPREHIVADPGFLAQARAKLQCLAHDRGLLRDGVEEARIAAVVQLLGLLCADEQDAGQPIVAVGDRNEAPQCGDAGLKTQAPSV